MGACASAAQGVDGIASPPTSAASPSVDQSTPAPTPDPIPRQTTAPGQHSEVIGRVTALSSTAIDVDGVTFALTAATEVKGSLALGVKVKLEYVINADGSRTVTEAKGPGFFDESGGSSDD